MRVLAALRLSREREESTSFPVQTATINTTVEDMSGTVVDTAEDMDVSAGTTGPFDRAGLGPYLNDPELIATYDAIAWAKLDRAIRNMMDLNDLAKFAVQNKKILIFCSGPGGSLVFDFRRRDPITNLILQFLAFAAELEWLAISERNKGAANYLRSIGRYRGGPIPYGLMKAKNPNGDGWVLVHDPISAPIVQEAVRRAIDGETPESICADFTKRGILTPKQHDRMRKGKEVQTVGRDGKPIAWGQASLSNDILRSRNLLGETEIFAKDEDGNFIKDENGKRVRKVIRDAAGMPVMRSEPLISHEDWQRLQDALNTRALVGVPRRKDANRLLGVAKCIRCQSNLYLREWKANNGETYGYYYCNKKFDGKKCSPGISTSVVEELIERHMLNEFGDLEIHERVFIPGEDHSDELARVTEAINGVRKEKDLGLYDGDEDGYLRRLTALVERRKALEALPSRPPRYEYVPSGTTYRQAWNAADAQGRRKLLLDSEVKAYVGKVENDEEKFALMANAKFDGPTSRGAWNLHAPIALTITYSSDIEKRITKNKDQLSSWEIQAKEHKRRIPAPKKPIVKKPDDGTIFTA